MKFYHGHPMHEDKEGGYVIFKEYHIAEENDSLALRLMRLEDIVYQIDFSVQELNDAWQLSGYNLEEHKRILRETMQLIRKLAMGIRDVLETPEIQAHYKELKDGNTL